VRPRLSIHLNNFGQNGVDVDRLVRLAENADAAGIDRVVVSDHVVFGNDLEAYADPRIGGIEGGKQPTGPDGWWLEPLAVLTYVAARTQNIRLGTSILLAALRRPIVLAKQLSTIDVMSNGRLDIGVGVGWQREEYTASDLDFAGRGGHLDRTLGALRAAWSGRMDWDGPAGSTEIHQYPRPVQTGADGAPRVPLWIAGTSRARTIDRIVRFGDGWIPWGPDIAEPSAGVAAIKRALDEAGRSSDDLCVETRLGVPGLRSGTPDWGVLRSEAARLSDAGVTDLRLDPVNVESSEHELDLLSRAVAEVAGR
jgi:probable F420-dependent oxidoreductase